VEKWVTEDRSESEPRLGKRKQEPGGQMRRQLLQGEKNEE